MDEALRSRDIGRLSGRCVAVVDPYRPVTGLSAAIRSLGCTPVRVQSRPQVPRDFAAAVDAESYVHEIVNKAGYEAMLSELHALNPAAVIAGGEGGVSTADRLAADLGLAGNPPSTSTCRSEKFPMAEALRTSGLAAVHHIKTSDPHDAGTWHRQHGDMVVVKPNRSAGGSGLYFCRTPEETEHAVLANLRSAGVHDDGDGSSVVQEYLRGPEYMVNTVSSGGNHIVSDAWLTTRINANGVLDLCDSIRILDPTEAVLQVLSDYAFQVLDALDVRVGPAHLEIKITDRGPVLVEIGARIPGGYIAEYAARATQVSQFELTALAYLDSENFNSRSPSYVLNQHLWSVAMISNRTGKLREYPLLQSLQGRLTCFNHEVRVLVTPGSLLTPTVDDFTYPMILNLMSSHRSDLERDYATIRYHDGDGFYAVAQAETQEDSA